MRKLNALLYLFLLGLVTLTACKDDDDDAPRVAANTVNIDGKSRSVNMAFALDLSGTSTTSDQYLLVLTTSQQGDVVLIGLNTPSNSSSLAGTYNAGSGTSPNTFNYAYIGFGCTEDPNDEDELICQDEYETAQPPVGRITISQDGNVYTVDFDITFEGGQKGLGNYKGSILM